MNRKLGRYVLLVVFTVVGGGFRLAGRAQEASQSANPNPGKKIETVGTIPSSGYTEGLCETRDGSFYITGIDEQIFWKVSPDGHAEKFAAMPAHIMVPLVTKNGFIATARQGVAPRSPLQDGRVRIDFSTDIGTQILIIDKTGKVTGTVPGMKGGYFNGLAESGHGFYLVADSGTPVLWKVDLAKKTIEPWFKDDQLTSPADASLNIGGNGIKVHGGWVYVGVSSRNAIYRVAIDSKGSPKGAMTMFAQGFRPDDFDIAKDGTIYVPSGNAIFKVSPAGEVSKFLEIPRLAATAKISRDGKWLYWPTRGGTEPQLLQRVAIP
ncbi:MAG TPA: hypothetical protein VG892_03135 [Terriglobales bacterium]|nr:hypothetical protein [Terriglobales bacterium]